MVEYREDKSDTVEGPMAAVVTVELEEAEEIIVVFGLFPSALVTTVYTDVTSENNELKLICGLEMTGLMIDSNVSSSDDTFVAMLDADDLYHGLLECEMLGTVTEC